MGRMRALTSYIVASAIGSKAPKVPRVMSTCVADEKRSVAQYEIRLSMSGLSFSRGHL
jgi:hypothetical protein